ncbi:MAG: cell division protein SepF [Candidatus Bathyarchaeia archaeon]
MPGLSGILRKSKKEEKETELKGASGKTYLKAMPLRDLSDLDSIKAEVKSGNILILRITPLANKSIDDVKRAVNELCEFAESLGGDIARLGEERVVVCPPNVRIWREKTQVSKETVVTAA